MRPSTAIGAIGLVTLLGVGAITEVAQRESRGTLDCRATDGDSLNCHGERIRLLYIDAPEMPTSPRHCERVHCPTGDPYAAQGALQWAITRGTVRCEGEQRDVYGRRLAECFVTAPGGASVSINEWMLSVHQAMPYHYRGASR